MIALAREHFAVIGDPEFSIDDERGYGGSITLVIDIKVDGTASEVVRQAETYWDAERSLIPAAKRGLILLMYHPTW